MKSVRTTVLAFVVVVAAVAGTVIWKTQQDKDSAGAPSSRERNTTFIPTSVDTSWGTDGLSLITQPSGITIADSASLGNGTVYSVGTTMTAGGLRAVVLRTSDGKTYDVRYAINPLKETLGGLGSFNSSVGQKISVDKSGNVWVAMTATTSTGTPTQYSVVTQLKPTLEYWGTPTSSVCSAVCGSIYASTITINDIQVNYEGNRVLIATSNGMDLFNVTAGRPLPLGVVTLTTGPNAANCDMTPVLLADDPTSGFVAVASRSAKKNLLFVTYSGVIPACTTVWSVLKVTGLDADLGNVIVYGAFFDEVAFSTYYLTDDTVLEMSMNSVVIKEQSGGKPVVPGQAAAWHGDNFYGSFTVQGDTPETYIVEYNRYNRSTTVFSSVSSSTSGAVASSQPPVLTLTGSSLVLTSSFTDRSSKAAALSVKLGLGFDGILSAPTFPAAEQNITVTYGQQSSVPFARATNAETYSLASGSLPTGMSLTSSGEILGSPQSVGYYTARIAATNPKGSAQTTLFIRSAATTPGAPTILGVEYANPVTVLGYVEGARGSDKDVVSAHFEGADGNTFNQQCLNGSCVIVNTNLPENKDVPVSLTQSNESGTTDAINTIIVRRNVLPDPVTNVRAKGGAQKAVVAFDPPADTHGAQDLSYMATVTDSADDRVIGKYWGCMPPSCELGGLPAGRGYVVTITVLTDHGFVQSEPSPAFNVAEARPEKSGPALATEDITVPAHEDFVLPLAAAATGDVRFDVNSEDLPEGVTYDSELQVLTGAVYAGTYVIGYSATDDNGTTEGTVTITATPSQLKAPGIMPAYSTYDRKFSVYPFYEKRSELWAADRFEWTSTVKVDGKDSVKNGTCPPGMKCTLPNAVWGQDLTLTLKAIPQEGTGDTESDTTTFIVHVPELPPAVPTGKISLQRMPDTSPGTAVLMGNVRMKPSMKFPLLLRAASTVQVDATTSCDVVNGQVVLRLEGPRNGCSTDPYVNLLSGDDVLAADDDGGNVTVSTGTDSDGNETFDSYNLLSSRLSTQVEPGEYTIEATSFPDQFKDDLERADQSDAEYDLWLTIITTPAEADRLMTADVVGTAYTGIVEPTVSLPADPKSAIVVPAELPAATSNTLPAPSQGTPVQGKDVSAASLVSMIVSPGPKQLTVHPAMLGGGKSAQVTVTANPGGRTCTADAGQSCTISGLSPWITYTLGASVSGEETLFTATGAPSLRVKAGSKSKVSSLGLSAAAKTMKLALKKGGVRVSGNCTLNSARTSVSFGKSGTCVITALTTQKLKSGSVNGPSLSATATIE